MTYYIVTMNNAYINCFKTFSEACELRESLERRFRTAKVEIHCEKD